jgi:phosphoribosylformylglycinamidine synthase
MGYVGRNVPHVFPETFADLYRALGRAVYEERVASVHGIYRGGLGVHLAMVAMGGNLGMTVDLGLVPSDSVDRNDVILFSESAGRFIITIDPENRKIFEEIFKGLPCVCIGTVTHELDFIVTGIDNRPIIKIPVQELKDAWKKPFGELI